MKKIKNNAFTLSEALITLAVVGILAVLVIPGLIKDVNNKAMMSLLSSTVTNLNDIVQTELTRSGASNIEDTDIWNKTDEFLKRTLDVVTVCSGATPNECYGKTSEYKNLNGTLVGLWATNQAVLLKSGVVIDIIKDQKSQFTNQVPIGLDLNGSKEPNITGVDRHIVCLTLKTDLEKPDEIYHIGDVGACLRNSAKSTAKESKKKALSLCKSGKTEACYYLVELTGFDHNYVTNIEKGVYDD